MNDDLHRILMKGGITSPGELKDSIAMLEAAGLSEVYFGSRQDLLFPLDNNKKRPLEKTSKYKMDIVADRSYQNIVCSYVSADIFDGTHWLKGSTYLYLLEQFDFMPRLKINITDPKQRLVPIFSGNLNFVASEDEDYWYLNILLPHWKKSAYYPVLIYSWDMVSVCRAIEEVYPAMDNVDQLFAILNQKLQTHNNRTIKKELQIPFVTFPYYEGMNRMGLDQFWLGLYWRNNRYDLQFLKEFCGFCLDNSIGKICITPWKSFIVKGISKESRPELERFLGQRGINVRHSQLEMNWHLPVDDQEALELKQYLVNNFDQNDISTYGLTFGISKDVGKQSHFSSIVIEKNPPTQIGLDYKVRPTYNVCYFKDFDPNTRHYLIYARDVDKKELPNLLIELSREYFQQLGQEKTAPTKKTAKKEQVKHKVHQCPNCLTVYDSETGDAQNGIEPHTKFEDLPEAYICPVCGSEKDVFEPVELLLG
ncbi:MULTISPECIES: rubredoxin [Flavobacteriaceae]|uniref:Rubredoxin n=1 Tax=Flagellimonas halotolerans TaxID=3112164 RepID=A0ABU6IT13_9FLAO|nr:MULTISPECIES: rubredoxin [unclassified Allomuricauda]MEC3966413.1 rubredoxin [Muricauda sp. SYSU M86414]MEC4266278.1 rubredoxin [Muricauda sp. SYSU M84420]NDV16714.1 rubredoxin [Muricauda sp. TY007]